MPDLLLVVLGVVVVVAVLLDAFMTTLGAAAGGGPLTRRLLGLCWRVLLRVHRRDARSSFLTAAGTVLLLLTVLIWMLLLWAGWTLAFLGSESVVEARTMAPASWSDVAYFTGTMIFTLGTGDYTAAATGWRLLSTVAGFTGLFLLTLSITYLVSVVAAEVARRSLAIQVHALGGEATEIVIRGWDGERFTAAFQQHLITLHASIGSSAEQHLAYPVLHYFHANSRHLSAPLAIAQLDDALLLLDGAVAEEHRPQPGVVDPLRSNLRRYVDTATTTSWSPSVGEPPAPATEALVAAGIPLVSTERFAEAVADVRDRRTIAHRMVVSDGWTWAGQT